MTPSALMMMLIIMIVILYFSLHNISGDRVNMTPMYLLDVLNTRGESPFTIQARPSKLLKLLFEIDGHSRISTRLV